MKKKLLILPVLALPFALFAPTVQAGSPTEGTPVACQPDHVTNPVTGPCQGDDIAPEENVCHIEIWVQSASCLITPDTSSGEIRTIGSGYTRAYPEVRNGQWHAEIHVKVTDLSSNTVVGETSMTRNTPLTSVWGPTSYAKGFSISPNTYTTDGPFLCEVTGTNGPTGVLPPHAPAAFAHNALYCAAV